MSDLASLRADLLATLVQELSAVTPAMLDAASRALTAAEIERRPDPQRPGRMVTIPAALTEADRLTLIWQAMLAAKLSPPMGGGTTG